MIYGIGTDICDIRRIEATLARQGERFAKRILGPSEFKVFQARSQRLASRGVRYLATRFSAKEAFSKAIGLGMTQPMSWSLCEILNTASGAPQVVLHGALSDWFEARNLNAHISMSDETDYTISYVVIHKIN
jgi:holo-[acyl-carrier protein] synthase